jgi:trk system potassium uptake protein TrkA
MANKNKQIGIIGLGVFGTNMAKALSKENCEVIAIDISEDRIKTVSDILTNVAQADATDEKILKELAFNEMDYVVIAIGNNLEASILITMLLKNMGLKNVIVKANSSLHAKVLMRVGADKIIFPEKDEAEKLAKSLISSNIIDMINFSETYSLVEMKCPKCLNGKKLIDSDIRNKFGLNVVAIRKKQPFITDSGDTDFKETLNISPDPDDIIEEGDSLVIIGENNNIEKFKTI